MTYVEILSNGFKFGPDIQGAFFYSSIHKRFSNLVTQLLPANPIMFWRSIRSFVKLIEKVVLPYHKLVNFRCWDYVV